MSGTTGYTSGAFPTSEGEGAKGLADQCCEQLSRAVDENPAGTLLTAFGVGLGVGAAIGLSVALATAPPKRKPRTLAEQLGDRVLESLQDLLPESFARRVG